MNIDDVMVQLYQVGLSRDHEVGVGMEVKFWRHHAKLFKAQLGAAQMMGLLVEIEPQRGFIRARWKVTLYGSTHDLFRWCRQFRNILPRL